MADDARAQSFNAFVRARWPSLLRTAFLLTGDLGQAEDAVQTALARTWLHWSRIDGIPDAYVRRAVVNACRSGWRRRWRVEVPTGRLPSQTVEDGTGAVDDSDAVRRLLAVLAPRQRAVVVLRYVLGLDEQQTADALGIAVGTVKSQGARALAALRQDPLLLSAVQRENEEDSA